MPLPCGPEKVCRLYISQRRSGPLTIHMDTPGFEQIPVALGQAMTIISPIRARSGRPAHSIWFTSCLSTREIKSGPRSASGLRRRYGDERGTQPAANWPRRTPWEQAVSRDHHCPPAQCFTGTLLGNSCLPWSPSTRKLSYLMPSAFFFLSSSIPPGRLWPPKKPFQNRKKEAGEVLQAYDPDCHGG